jgi:hypothetical protein
VLVCYQAQRALERSNALWRQKEYEAANVVIQILGRHPSLCVLQQKTLKRHQKQDLPKSQARALIRKQFRLWLSQATFLPGGKLLFNCKVWDVPAKVLNDMNPAVCFYAHDGILFSFGRVPGDGWTGPT